MAARSRTTPAPSPAAKRHATRVWRRLAKLYPDSGCSLDHRNPLELLVATILSAQCTDVRVNQVTPKLFAAFPSAAHYARGSAARLEAAIHSTGFYRNKAKAIRGAAEMLVDEYDGEVPDTMEALLRLPGVARKTANVVLGNAFGKSTGVVVDTHVFRISHRLGLAVQKNPNHVEQELMALLPQREWVAFSHRVIDHGRAVCHARRPACAACELADLCPSAEV